MLSEPIEWVRADVPGRRINCELLLTVTAPCASESSETLAVAAYLGPVSRPDVARLRGVAADTVVAGLVERGLLTEAGREPGVGGAVRYRTTELFERVFGLESLSALPRLEDLGDEAEQIRGRLEEVDAQRGA